LTHSPLRVRTAFTVVVQVPENLLGHRLRSPESSSGGSDGMPRQSGSKTKLKNQQEKKPVMATAMAIATCSLVLSECRHQ
jgi:hypothetical protein